MECDKAVRVYDYNGVIASVDGLRAWFQQTHPQLWHRYKVEGAKDPAVLREVLPQVQALYEQATTQGLYPVSLMPSVQERLMRDACQGYGRIIFTSVPKAVTERQIAELGIASSIDELVTLSEIQNTFNLGNAVKEDPIVFCGLAEYLTQQGVGEMLSYVDDTEKRVISAVAAHRQLISEGRRGINRIYHFDTKLAVEKELADGYEKINNLLQIE